MWRVALFSPAGLGSPVGLDPCFPFLDPPILGVRVYSGKVQVDLVI